MESCEPRSPTSQPPDAECLTAVHTAVQEADARDIFRQLILLVDYLHRMGVAHRNIKLESIALEGDRKHPVARLVDLGPAVLPHASIKADGLEPASHVGYTGAPPLAPFKQLPPFDTPLAASCCAKYGSVPAAVHEPAKHSILSLT